MDIRGIIDIDFLCLEKIFKFLKPLDLCSMRQACTQLRESADNYFRSLYFTREQWLDLRGENIRDVRRILKNFGKFVRCLKVSESEKKFSQSQLLFEVIASNCDGVLKGLYLEWLQLYKTETERFAGVFNNLDILEIVIYRGDHKSIQNMLLKHQYPNLTTLKIKNAIVGGAILNRFFMRPRKIKKLMLSEVDINGTLPLIVQNASEIEELNIFPQDDRNVMLVAQLYKLKQLTINCFYFDQRFVIAFIKELSVNSQLETLGIINIEFTNEFCDALSNLTNLKGLRFEGAYFTVNHTKSIELLGEKLSKLECLMLTGCYHFPYQSVLPSTYKSVTFRNIYFLNNYDGLGGLDNFIEEIVNNYSDGRGHSCFVSGNPLRIYLLEETFNKMRGLLTQSNLQSIETYGNIKIRRANCDHFFSLT